MGSCFTAFSCCGKHDPKKLGGEKGLFLLILPVHHWMKPRQNSRQEPEAKTAGDTVSWLAF